MKNKNSILSIVISGVILFAGLVIAVVVFFVVQNVVKSWGVTKLPGVAIQEQSVAVNTPKAGETAVPLPAIEVVPDAGAPPAWDGASRVNILVLGLDYRDWIAGEGPPRSDTMMLLTIDPLSKSGGLLSIPRDLWVNIPGFNYGRINTAYMLGEGSKLPGGGPALAAKTVEALLGVPIHYYAQIDFSAFITFIDAIGGIKIEVTEPIKIDMLGDSPIITNKKQGKQNKGDRTVKVIKPGKYNFSGEMALAYARQRYTQGGDFDRAQRQQQVVMAIRDRMLQFDRLGILITEIPKIYQQVASGIHTNMTFDEAFRLGWLAKDIPMEKIKKGIIGKDQVIFAKSPDGTQDVLKPRPQELRALRDEVFASTQSISPIAQQGLELAVQSEQARIAVRNGSIGSGVAAQAGQYLSSIGLNVVETGDAEKPYSATTLIDYSGNPYTLRYLQQLLGISPRMLISQYTPNSAVDVAVVVGNDWRQP